MIVVTFEGQEMFAWNGDVEELELIGQEIARNAKLHDVTPEEIIGHSVFQNRAPPPSERTKRI
jgi:hypothetical protein